MSEAPPLKVWVEREGALLRLRLARPKANVIDGAMIAALGEALDRHLDHAELRAVLLDADGPHFSFGASVEEHLPEHCAEMLEGFHGLLLKLLSAPLPVLVAIQGQCLGGGLELACAGTMLFAAPDAKLGQPEINLAVFAPAASCLLPLRIGQGRAEDLLLSGRSVDAQEALSLGLVNAVAEDPEAAALAYFERHLEGKSASSLRLAVRAARKGVIGELKCKLAAVEELYIKDLMATDDATEGLKAFLEKRAAQWEHR